MKNHIALALSVTFLASCAQYDYTNLSSDDRELFSRQITTRINKKCPITNGSFRVEKAQVFGYSIIITGTDLGTEYDEKVNYKEYYSQAIAGEINIYCNTPDYKHAREAGIQFEYVYQDKSGKLLHDFTVNNSACKKTTLVPKVKNNTVESVASKDKLIELKTLYDEGIITKEEYEQKRQSIFDEL